MSRSTVGTGLVGVAWDDGGHDEPPGADVPAGADRSHTKRRAGRFRSRARIDSEVLYVARNVRLPRHNNLLRGARLTRQVESAVTARSNRSVPLSPIRDSASQAACAKLGSKGARPD
jgi:hypothetical protein